MHRAILSRKINTQQTSKVGFGYPAAGNLLIATDNNLKMFYKESVGGKNQHTKLHLMPPKTHTLFTLCDRNPGELKRCCTILRVSQ